MAALSDKAVEGYATLMEEMVPAYRRPLYSTSAFNNAPPALPAHLRAVAKTLDSDDGFRALCALANLLEDICGRARDFSSIFAGGSVAEMVLDQLASPLAWNRESPLTPRGERRLANLGCTSQRVFDALALAMDALPKDEPLRSRLATLANSENVQSYICEVLAFTAEKSFHGISA
ncbi:MAG: hypothetical protein J0L97_07390 [Alphaproteobacteria bacterium]|nr:hypothetical protein [Alphaproteobacteria bacterium]